MKLRNTANKILAIGAALLVWQLAASLVRLDILLPSPLQVLREFFLLLPQPQFLSAVGFSLLRIAAGFFAAFLLGNLLALLAGRVPVFETLLWPYVVTIKTVPVASFVIICFIWLRGGQLPTFISFLMVFPMIYTNTLEGIKSTDRQLLELAQLYRVPYGRRLRYIYLPHLRPYILSASSVSLGMAWKSGIAAEVIAIVSGSLGERLYQSKIYLQIPQLLAWTVVIVLVSVLMEKLVMLLLKKGFALAERRRHHGG